MAKSASPAPRRHWSLVLAMVFCVVACGSSALFVSWDPSTPGNPDFLRQFNPKSSTDVFVEVGDLSAKHLYCEVLEFRQVPSEIYAALRKRLVDDLGWNQTPLDDGFLYRNPVEQSEMYSFDNGTPDPSEPYSQGIRCRLYYFRPSSFVESLRHNTKAR